MMNIKYGASLLSWTTPDWTHESGLYAIEKTAETGFELLEILLPHTADFDAPAVKKHLNKHGISAVCSLNFSEETHLPAHPKEALALIKKSLDRTAALDADFMGGVLHSAIGCFTGNPVTDAEKDTVVNVWGEAALYALERGITMGIEPINRYESYVCNTSDNVLELIEKTGMPNLALHLDTFHMNIEEANFKDPILRAGNRLKHLHITESHRGMPGDGTVNWDELFEALNTINFEGNLVLENFSSEVPGMQQAVSLWQKSPFSAQELAEGSLAFMKNKVKQFSI
ncbi:sugar phosphate isomerase/epimerase family protein [Leeuwenhoekiella sp. NPDC079379]|uniref:sugar phosphate isomerase/epimerase family protein n=1 Tax=Leeuwenhoekiella sp. NPDC079379 TaxID=3364122 RepID=UPI0037C67810